MIAKIITLNQLITIKKDLKKQGKTIVFTNGCFDILHTAHILLFLEAKRCGDILAVAVNTDESIRKLKGSKRPVFPLEERLEVLDAVEAIDYLLPFSEETPLEIISQLLPDVLIKGGDWKPEDIVGKQEVARSGGRVVIFPFVAGYSTTEIIKRIGGRYDD
ncbi:MAG: adenylyltransferase/cytidyltransferase family protein [Candidatus Aminicenantes bacterium]|nr:adenylyltransferase/cytidyltransferase family protein [Candidatus Aminicenantes bacterium]